MVAGKQSRFPNKPDSFSPAKEKTSGESGKAVEKKLMEEVAQKANRLNALPGRFIVKPADEGYYVVDTTNGRHYKTYYEIKEMLSKERDKKLDNKRKAKGPGWYPNTEGSLGHSDEDAGSKYDFSG